MKSKIILLLVVVLWLGCGSTKLEAGIEIQPEDALEDPLAMIDRAEDQRVLKPRVLALADRAEVGVRARLAQAIGRIGDPNGATVLVELLQDPKPQVQDAAAFSAMLLGENASSKLKQTVLQRLGQVDRADGVGALLSTIGHALGGEAIPHLVELLKDDRAVVRGKVLKAFGLLGKRNVSIPAPVKARITAHLNDDAQTVRLMSLFALNQFFPTALDQDKLSSLIETAALNDPAYEIRAYAFRALAIRGLLNKQTIEKAITDPDDRVAAAAVSAIGLGDKQRQCALAARALDGVAARIETDPTLVLNSFAHAVQAALEISADCPSDSREQELVKRIETSVKTLTEPGTAGTAQILCLTRLVTGRDELALLSCDPKRPENGKRMVIKRLSRGSDAQGQNIETLKEMVADADPRVSKAALYALGNSPKSAGQKVVLTALGNRQTLTVVAALNTITAFPTRFGSKEGDRVVTAIAKVVERFLPFPHAHTPLIASIDALTALNHRAAEPILRTLVRDARPPIRHAALDAFDAIGGITAPKGLPGLAPFEPVPHQEMSAWRNLAADAIIRTTRGSFSMTLRSDIAPATVRSFVALQESGYYDNTDIYQVVPNGFIRAGDRTGTGLDDPGYALRSEMSNEPFERGTVGLDLMGKDTGGGKFFITLSRQPALDGMYPVFGQVTSGLEVLDRLTLGDRILGIGVKIEE